MIPRTPLAASSPVPACAGSLRAALLCAALFCAAWLAAPCPGAAAASLEEALAAIRAKPKVDLTHPLVAAEPRDRPVLPLAATPFGGLRVAPAVDPRRLEPFTLHRDGFRASYYALPGPSGTHVVAPASVTADGRTLDAVAPEEMILPLVVLDDTPFLAADPAHAFSPDDLAAHEKAHGRVPNGSFVALRTGLAGDWGTPAFARRPFPGWSLAVLRILLEERGATAIGQESLEAAVDPRGSAYVLGRGCWMVAGLDRLDALPATGAAIVVSWPRVAGGFAFPARAFAVLP